MKKHIDADEFIKKYNEIDLHPYIHNGYAQQIDGYEMWEEWKKEFDRTVRRILSELSYVQENEDVIIGKIKEIPLIPISLPSADVVEVVRCKDCKRSIKHSEDVYECGWLCAMTTPEFYCADGERKETDG